MTLPSTTKFVALRNAFFSGMLLLAPLVVTVWAFDRLIGAVGGTFRPVFFFYLPASLLDDKASLSIVWNILSTIIVIGLVTLVGYTSGDVVGRLFFSFCDRLLRRLPGLGAVYNTVKQIVDTFGSKNRHLFNKVVLVQFPYRGCWTVGFLTNNVQGEAQKMTQQGDVWTVFVPTTPNPTSGFLLMVPRTDLVELDMSTGEAMKMIISGGAVVPPWPPAQASAAESGSGEPGAADAGAMTRAAVPPRNPRA